MPSHEVNERRRNQLMKATIQIVAEKGLENTAANVISTVSGVNVAYIYRLFEDKDDLIAKTFAKVDEDLINKVMENLVAPVRGSENFEQKCREIFMNCWNFIMSKPEEFSFYVQYYYSASFQKFANETHMERCGVLLERLTPAFAEGVNVETVMHHILNTLLGRAIKHINSKSENTERAAEDCFRLIYGVVVSHTNI